MLLAVIGFTAVTLARIDTRKTVDADNWLEAGSLAFSAVEYALCSTMNTPDWRAATPAGSDLASPERTLGGGTISFVIRDENDGDLSNDPSDPLRIYGIARVGGAVRVHSALAQPSLGLDILRAAVHSGTEIHVEKSTELILTGGHASSNGNIRNDAIIYGDAVAYTMSTAGVVTGETTLVAPRAMPGTSVLQRYQNLATQIPFPGHISGQVLSPGENPWGAANQEGIYYIDTMGNDMDLQGCRIHGTLIVRCSSKKLRLKDVVFMEPYRDGYPALIVDGTVELSLESETMQLSEADWGRNFNSPDSPYEGGSDSDMTDSYPNEVRGLVHVFGQLSVYETTRVRGVVLCHDKITIEGSAHVIHDGVIHENPPLGYAAPDSPLVIIPNSWRWSALPGP